MQENSGSTVTRSDDRRVHHNLRAIFDDVCQATVACFTSSLEPGGMSMHITARRLMHELHPELTHQEIAILFSAVERFHRRNGQ